MKSVIVALQANILVAISKFIGFAISGSAAMLNESIHSVVDCGNQILLLVGDKRANNKESNKHPFGEARAKYFFSMVVAMFLFFGAGVIGVMEAYDKLVHPEHTVTNPIIIIGIIVFGMIVEGRSLTVAIKEINHNNNHKLPLFKFLHESRHSEILIVFAEDLCAIIGLLIALLGTLLTMATGNPVYDASAGILIGVLLMGVAVLLTLEFYSLIVGEAANEDHLKLISKAFDTENVDRLLDLKTTHIGPTEILVTAKIDVVNEFEDSGYKIINDIEKKMRALIPDITLHIYIEIDEYDEHHSQA